MIDNIIPKQNFEIVRDAIGTILVNELANQKTLQGLEDDAVVFAERTTPIQNDELVSINVSFDSVDYSSKTQQSNQGRNVFNIDVYTIGQARINSDGSTDSSFRLHKYLGMVRYILSHTIYKTLNLPMGFIGGTKVESIVVMEPEFKQDSNFVRMARLILSVSIVESQTLEEGVELHENLTSVKLHETELGFVYQFNN